MAGKEADARLRAALRRWAPRCEEFVRGDWDGREGAPWMFVAECSRLLNERDAALAEVEQAVEKERDASLSAKKNIIAGHLHDLLEVNKYCNAVELERDAALAEVAQLKVRDSNNTFRNKNVAAVNEDLRARLSDFLGESCPVCSVGFSEGYDQLSVYHHECEQAEGEVHARKQEEREIWSREAGRREMVAAKLRNELAIAEGVITQLRYELKGDFEATEELHANYKRDFEILRKERDEAREIALRWMWVGTPRGPADPQWEADATVAKTWPQYEEEE